MKKSIESSTNSNLRQPSLLRLGEGSTGSSLQDLQALESSPCPAKRSRFGEGGGRKLLKGKAHVAAKCFLQSAAFELSEGCQVSRQDYDTFKKRHSICEILDI